MKVGISGGAFWRLAYRLGWVRAHLPQWRVVVDARPKAPIASPDGSPISGAVCGVIVWAQDPEEAEAIARLCVELEGYDAITADANPIAPQSPPKREPQAVARTGYALYGAETSDTERAR